MYSAMTAPLPRSLMFLMSASGKVFSRPTKIPTFFIEIPFVFVFPKLSTTGECLSNSQERGMFWSLERKWRVFERSAWPPLFFLFDMTASDIYRFRHLTSLTLHLLERHECYFRNGLCYNPRPNHKY